MTSQMALRIDPLMDEMLSLFDEKGNLTTGALVDFTEKSRATVTKRLDKLSAADCIEYVHEPTALWRLVADPREDGDSE
jgi:DNA-binding MarR family transcriptional regulator